MTGATGKQLAFSLLRVVQSPEEQTVFSTAVALPSSQRVDTP